MEEIKRAKQKAENWFYWILGQEWSDFYRKDNYEISSELSFEVIDWPLRFEAYSYLGYRYKNKSSDFALKIRELWSEWIKLSEEGLLRNKRFFWPMQYTLSSDNKEKKKKIKASEIETYVSMFRAKEILGVGGFDSYFNEAKKRISDMLFPDPHIDLSQKNIEITWQIVRSPYLKFELSDCLKVIASKIIEREHFKSINFLLIAQAVVLFFLCFGNFNREVANVAKKYALELINEQEKNGSFDFNPLATCLIASSIQFMKLDPSNSVCRKAVEFILKNQKDIGCWDFLHRWDNHPKFSTPWCVFSTVVALETIDFITDDKPLPIWAEKVRPSKIPQKHPRIQIDEPLPVPEGINWQDVTIEFISEDSVEIRATIPLGVKNFIVLGFKKGKTNKPDLAWYALIAFALGRCEISWGDRMIDEETRERLKSCLKVIRPRLSFLFKIEDKPFEPYDRKENAYRAKFNITIREDIKEDILDKLFASGKFPGSFQKKS